MKLRGTTKRRPEILRLIENHVYGRSPAPPLQLDFRESASEPAALGGKAIRREITITVAGNGKSVDLHLLVFLPPSSKPVPTFLGLNFAGNHSIHPDPAITLSTAWMRKKPNAGKCAKRSC